MALQTYATKKLGEASSGEEVVRIWGEICWWLPRERVHLPYEKPRDALQSEKDECVDRAVRRMARNSHTPLNLLVELCDLPIYQNVAPASKGKGGYGYTLHGVLLPTINARRIMCEELGDADIPSSWLGMLLEELR